MHAAAATTRKGTHCVMLLPRSVEPDNELLNALTRRDLDVHRADSALVAFARLVRHIADVRDGVAAATAQILLLVEPARLGDPAGLIRSVEHYAPKVACWLFDPTSTPKLRAVQAADVESWAERAQARREAADTTPLAADWATPYKLVAQSNGVSAEIEATPATPGRSVGVGSAPAANGTSNARPNPPSSPSRANGTLGQLLSSDELAMLLASDRTMSQNRDAGQR